MVQTFVELERKQIELLEAQQNHLQKMKGAIHILLESKDIQKIFPREDLRMLRAFHENPVQFVEQNGIQILQQFSDVVHKLVPAYPEEEEVSFEPALQVFAPQAVHELIGQAAGIKSIQRNLDVITTSEECEEDTSGYLELKREIAKIIRLQDQHAKYSRELNQLTKEKNEKRIKVIIHPNRSPMGCLNRNCQIHERKRIIIIRVCILRGGGLPPKGLVPFVFH